MSGQGACISFAAGGDEPCPSRADWDAIVPGQDCNTENTPTCARLFYGDEYDNAVAGTLPEDWVGDWSAVPTPEPSVPSDSHPMTTCEAVCAALNSQSGPNNTASCDIHFGCVFDHTQMSGQGACISFAAGGDEPCPSRADWDAIVPGQDCNTENTPTCARLFYGDEYDNAVAGTLPEDWVGDWSAVPTPEPSVPSDSHPMTTCEAVCAALNSQSGPNNTASCDIHFGCVFDHTQMSGQGACISFAAGGDEPCPSRADWDAIVPGQDCNTENTPTCARLFYGDEYDNAVAGTLPEDWVGDWSAVPTPEPSVPSDSHPTTDSHASFYPASSPVPGETPNAYPTQSPVPGETPNAYPTSSPNAYPTQSPVPGEAPNAYPTQSPVPGEAPNAYPTPSPVPGETPNAYPTSSPNAYPTQSPVPGEAPNAYPTPSPNAYPTQSPVPGEAPNAYPTQSPVPGETPNAYPTSSPNAYPTQSPVPGEAPNAYPTPSPVPGEAPNAYPTPSPVPGETPNAYPTQSPVPGETPNAYPTQSPVPGEAPNAYPTQSPVPGETPNAYPTQSPVPGETSNASPTQSPVPGETPNAYPTPEPRAGRDAERVTRHQSPVPGETPNAYPTPSPSAFPTPSPVPSETPNAYPTPSPSAFPTPSPVPGETPAVGPTYSEPIAQIVYETKSVVRLVGYHAGAFGETQSRLFKVGMATFYKVAPEDISISSVKDVVSSSSRRLLQTSAIDVNYTVTSTTIESVLEVANQTNSAVTTTQGEVYDDLRAAGLIISDAVILLEAQTTEKASALAPSGPYDINVNLHLDVDVHVDNAPASREPTSSTPGGNPADTEGGNPSTPTSSYPAAPSDCVPVNTETEAAQYYRNESLQHEALETAQSYARQNDLPLPDAHTFVRAKVCNAPHMRCCSELNWRQDNRVRFPFVCGDSAGCAKKTFDVARKNCVARGGDLCRGNAVSTSMHDPSCVGTKSDYVWTLTHCDVNGVHGRVIRPSAGGAPGALCETNLMANHQSRCCSNVC